MTNSSFKNEIVSLVAVLRVGRLQKAVEKQYGLISELREYSQTEYNGAKEGYTKALEDYCKNSTRTINKIGDDIYESAEKAFCALTLAEQNSLWGITEEISEPKKVFEEIFFKTKERVQNGEDGGDDFCLWLSAADEVLFGTQERIEPTMQCSCGGFLERVPAETVGLQKGYVFRCPECGNYAHIDSKGCLVGVATDKATHELRERCYTAVKRFCDEKGLTLQEALRYISRKAKISLSELSDVESLSAENCQQVIGYVMQKTIFNTENAVFPCNYEELMSFFKNGGRFRVNRSLSPKRSGRLFIPVAVVQNALIIKSEEGNDRFLLPDALDYYFDGDTVTVKHPTQTEIFKLFPQFIA